MQPAPAAATKPPSPRWHLDEMVCTIGGERMFLWRAVDDEGEVTVNVRLHRDQQGLFVVDGRLATTVKLTCQRCLKPVEEAVDIDRWIRFVDTEAEAVNYGKQWDMLVAAGAVTYFATLAMAGFRLRIAEGSAEPADSSGSRINDRSNAM